MELPEAAVQTSPERGAEWGAWAGCGGASPLSGVDLSRAVIESPRLRSVWGPSAAGRPPASAVCVADLCWGDFSSCISVALEPSAGECRLPFIMRTPDLTAHCLLRCPASRLDRCSIDGTVQASYRNAAEKFRHPPKISFPP